MICMRCEREIPEGSVFCLYCGKKQIQEPEKRKRLKRGNNTGSVRKRGRTYSAVWTYKSPEVRPDGSLKQFRREKGAFLLGMRQSDSLRV